MKLNTSLLKLITQMEPIEFVGLARLLGVSLMQSGDDGQDPAPRGALDVLQDVLNKFDQLSRVRKREILKLVKQSNKGQRGGHNASDALDS